MVWHHWVMDLFTRSSRNPILVPSGDWWEARGVLNPGAVQIEDRVVLVYRAVGADGLSRFGLARLEDGERIVERRFFYEPSPGEPATRLGIEDPRLTLLDGNAFLTYTQVSVGPATEPPLPWEFAPFRLRSAVARTPDFTSVDPSGIILPAVNTKDSVLFPARIGGEYAALVRDYPSIQYTSSPDLQHWSEPVTLLEPLPGTWEGERVGAGPPPLLTPWGWLLLYHGNEYLRQPGNRRLYRMGLAVLDRDRPWSVRYRHPQPVFEPEAPYEIEGPVGNVVFGTGLVERAELLYLYYGAGDGVIGLATAARADLDALLEAALGPPA